jgi:RNA polymerase sigma-54 factor
LVSSHLDAVAAGDHYGIAVELGVAVSEIDKAVRFLQTRLRPFATLEASDEDISTPAPPDVIVRQDPNGADSLEVEVLGAQDLGLSLDHDLLRLSDVSAESRAWLAGHFNEARTLLELIDRRASTLRRVAVAVVHAQRSFVLGGPADHLPLTRTDIARALGLNVSTVSRAVQQKVVCLPDHRQEPMSAFFGSAVAVKDRLARLLSVQSEPRPDSYFADRLAAAGHPVARRTVAKYRLSLGVPD